MVIIMSEIDLPLGFGMALSQNEKAMKKFELLSEEEKRALIEQTRTVNSESEMKAFVNNLTASAEG